MAQGLIYIIGIALSRGVLLILGAIIAHILGENSYVQFVLFLTMTNIITNFSLMGVSPRILSHRSPPELSANEDSKNLKTSFSAQQKNNLLAFQYGGIANFFIAFLITACLFLNDFHWLSQLGEGTRSLFLLSVFFYCFGYFMLSLAAALLNRVRKHALAGYLWIFISVFSFLVAFILVHFKSYSLFLLLFSLGWSIFGLYSWYIISKDKTKDLQNGISLWNVFSLMKWPSPMIAWGMLKSIYSSLFGLPFLIIFFLLGQQVNFSVDLNNKSAFFLGFQLFSLILFIPGALGNVFVPRLSQAMQDQKKKLVRQFSVFYLAIGCAWLILIYFILPFLFQWYLIKPDPLLFNLVLIWQVAGIFAALGAIQNQLLVAYHDYFFLLIGSLVWAACVLVISNVFGDVMQGGALGVLVAYIVLQLLYWYKNNKHFNQSNAMGNEQESTQVQFLANPYSPHVRHWETLLKQGGYDLKVYTAHGMKGKNLLSSPIEPIIPSLFNLFPSGVRYVIAGLLLRSHPRYSSIIWLHAHNTSGYGLAAFLSGKPYLITTYGSEIFNSERKGKLYNFLISLTLKKAKAITSTSSTMTNYLIEHFAVPQAKIYEFSLGVSPAFYFNPQSRADLQDKLNNPSSPIWIANRRIRPLYHTLEVIDAFIAFRKQHSAGFLILIEGDSNKNYYKQVELKCADQPAIKLIKGFLSEEELAQYLSASDFSISVPETDQLSSSILEAATCGALPLLSSLPAYQPLWDFCKVFNIADVHASQSYESLFIESYQLFLTKEYEEMKEKMMSKMEQFKMEKVVQRVSHLYYFTSEQLINNKAIKSMQHE